MSTSFMQSGLLPARVEAAVERELDLGITAIADTVVRSPFGSMQMNLGATRVNSASSAVLGSTVRSPFGCLKMNLGMRREALVISESAPSS
jgi:hypothetical protein